MRFFKNDDGAVLIYVTLILGAFIGLGGLALDASRAFTLREEMQQAADAAALAGAWQLDGTAAGSLRADAAARAVVANSQKWASGGSAAVTIGAGTAGVQFMSTVPTNDDAALTFTGAAPYDYIWVKTTSANFDPWFMRMFGGAQTQVSAEAVANKGSSQCQVTPLFMCLPGGSSFDPTAWIGHQVLMKAAQGGSWTNGNWGLLDTPGGSQSAGALASMIAGVNGLPQCIDSGGVDTKPGNVASISAAFNVRLDVYENLPGGVNYQNTPGYAPAEHVQKGTATNATCTARPTKVNNAAVPGGFPRDADIISSGGATRFGNGQWDCTNYWSLAHLGNTANIPGACSSTGGLTRYETYLHEITTLANKALIPDLSGAGGDNGDPTERSPICYTGGSIPPTPTALSQRINDRRIFTVAGVDCSTVQINGNTSNVPVLQYLSMFLTEPAGTQGPTNGDVYMEIVGFDQGGGGGLVPIQLREWTELVR